MPDRQRFLNADKGFGAGRRSKRGDPSEIDRKGTLVTGSLLFQKESLDARIPGGTTLISDQAGTRILPQPAPWRTSPAESAASDSTQSFHSLEL